MSHKNEINGIPMLGSIKLDSTTYCIDLEENIYMYDAETKLLTLVTDVSLVNKILDYLEAKPLDIK